MRPTRARSRWSRAAPRPAARPACRRGRRPGAGSAACRRRGAAPPRRGGAPGRAAATSCAHHSVEGCAAPASSSRSAASSARRRWLPGPRTSPASSPGVHEALARELLRALDLLGVGDGRGRKGHWREFSQGGVRRDAMMIARQREQGTREHNPRKVTSQRRGTSKRRSPPETIQSVPDPGDGSAQAGRRAQVDRRSGPPGDRRGGRRGPAAGGGRRLLRDRPEVAEPRGGRAPARRAAAGSRRVAPAHGGAGRRRRRALRLRAAGSARLPRRRQSVGVVVRPVPVRDPVHPAPVPRARDEGRLPRRELRRLRLGRRARMAEDLPMPYPSIVDDRAPSSPAASARAACR